MTPEHKFDPKDGPLLSPYEEMLRSRAASERFRERVRNDPAYAREVLEEIGYFEMMADENGEAGGNSVSADEDSHHYNGADSA